MREVKSKLKLEGWAILKTGLVSISFRKLSPEEIIKLVSRAGLQGIEWGGDVHVPHGDLERAREVSKMTRDAGLEAASYGSYYEVGCEKEKNIPFEKVLDTAKELGALTIRVWAGNRGSKDADQSWWNTVVEESRRIADIAQRTGITVAYEYHRNTLTDTTESAYRLLKEVGHRNIRSYWQPTVEWSEEACLDSIEKIIPWLSNIHIFHWESRKRMPLEEGIDKWLKYMEVIKKAEGSRYCMIEFVKDDEPEQFLADAEAVKKIIGITGKI